MMNSRLTILMLCIFFNEIVCKKSKHLQNVETDGKIVGGNVTVIQEVPYQVSLVLQMFIEIYECGGSIISENYVLTAAHCLVGMQSATIRIGSTDSGVGGNQYFSTKLRQHPLYNSINSDYDVGLIQVVNGMNLDGVNARAVSLPKRGAPVEIGTEVLVSGWGTTSENGLTSEVLRAVKVPVVSQDECRKSYPTLTSRQFCAGLPEGGKDSCQGDSGGPAVTQSGVQVGIVSYGAGCARPGYPGVYTRISKVLLFIHIHTGL